MGQKRRKDRGLIANIKRLAVRALLGKSLDQPWVRVALGLPTSKSTSGYLVSEDTALAITAVYACVRIISSSLAMLPLGVFERIADDKREAARNHPLYLPFKYQPNPDMSAYSWKEVVLHHCLLWGNHYSQIIRNRGRQFSGLYPLLPNRMQVYRNPDGTLRYEYLEPKSLKKKKFSQDEILHIHNLSVDGIIGKSPIAIARDALGLAIAAETYGSRFFKNDTTPSIIIRHPGVLGDEGKKNLAEVWNALYGHENQRGIAVIEEGADVVKLGIPPEDSQFLETRKFQIAEIARIYGVPPHPIGDLDRATFNNIEHMGIEFVVYCLAPWTTRIEQEINRKLIGIENLDRYFVEFNFNALLRGDTESRFRSYQLGINNGWLSPNDARRMENLNPIENGDEYYRQLNLTFVGQPPADGGDGGAKGARGLAQMMGRNGGQNG